MIIEKIYLMIREIKTNLLYKITKVLN